MKYKNNNLDVESEASEKKNKDIFTPYFTHKERREERQKKVLGDLLSIRNIPHESDNGLNFVGFWSWCFDFYKIKVG